MVKERWEYLYELAIQDLCESYKFSYEKAKSWLEELLYEYPNYLKNYEFQNFNDVV